MQRAHLWQLVTAIWIVSLLAAASGFRPSFASKEDCAGSKFAGSKGELTKLLVTGAVVPGTRQRLVDATDLEALPKEILETWNAAPVFEQNAEPNWKQRLGNFFGRRVTIDQLNEVRSLLMISDLGVGELTKGIEVIALHDRNINRTLEREVLVEIQGKNYRLVVPLENVSDSGAYRSTSVPLGFRFNRHVEWENLNEEQRALLLDRDSKGRYRRYVVELPGGARYTRVKDPGLDQWGPVWEDSRGLRWGGLAKTRINHYDAMKKYETKTTRLPTEEEIERLRDHPDERKFLFSGIENNFYWSSSSRGDVAYALRGSNGKFLSLDRRSASFDFAVRCVRQRPREP